MGAGARRRAQRRAAEDSAVAREAAAYWRELAQRWEGPQRGRSAVDVADAQWARDVAASIERGASLLDAGPASPRVLARLARAQADIDAALPAVVGRLRELGTTWEQIGDVLGISRQAAQKRYSVGQVTSPG